MRSYDALLGEASQRAEERLAQIGTTERKEKTDKAIRRLGGVTEKLDLSIESKKGKKIATHLETYEFLKVGKTLDDIANLRNLKSSTIFSHLEKLLEEGKTLDISPYRPTDEERLSQIHKGFVMIGSTSLTTVREYLADIHDEEFDYDELRIARLFLSDSDHRKISQQMLYESEGIESD